MARNGIRPMSEHVFESAGEPTTTTVAPISVSVYYAIILVFCGFIVSRFSWFFSDQRVTGSCLMAHDFRGDVMW